MFFCKEVIKEMDEREKKKKWVKVKQRNWVRVKGLCLTLQLFAIPSIPPLHLLSVQCALIET